MDMKNSPLSSLKDAGLLKTQGLIGGQWLDGPTRFDVTDPATGLHLASVANLGPAHAQQAIDAAQAALPGWRSKTAKERHALLMKWFTLLVAHTDDLARIMTAEQGKPLAEAKGEVAYGASFVEWFAEEAKRVNGETLPQYDNNKRLLVIKQPIGVCAAITPWNFPIAMITRKVAPAIAAGCTVVIKPAEQTPLSALAAAELALRAGIPPGVINVLCADSANSIAIGKVLCASDVVRHLSFTGSTEVGRILMQQSAPTIKKLSLELGGNAPFIAFDDCDLDSAVDGAMASKYRNAGQTCVCANRMYVQEGIYDAFVAKLAEKAKTIKVGNGFESGVNQGPLIDEQAIRKVEQHVADAVKKGATVMTGGKKLEGQFFEPTVLANVSTDMLVAREETFGPVAPVFKFKTEAEVIAMA
ncbi:MAG: NAD-dependent succinate-semialdehyde dehydrogenase, partial [Betaproteobacteria bacterium]|nr:NAD-dependent succinate-semialdehyde dehydrogenase [Betaproteobacteria bacterium]